LQSKVIRKMRKCDVKDFEDFCEDLEAIAFSQGSYSFEAFIAGNKKDSNKRAEF